MRFAPRALLAGGLGFAVSLLAACGGGAGLLSGGQSSTLASQLDAVQSAVTGHDCPGALNAVAGFSNAIVNLPPTVSPTLRSNLMQGAQTVAQLSAHDCHSTTTTTSSTSSSTTPTSTSSSSSTTSTPTSSSSTSSSSSSSTSHATSSSSSSTSPSGGGGLGGGGKP